MKPQKQEILYKEFIKVQERISELYDLIAEAPYIPLPKKIFAGHWRFFKVRDDVLRSSIGEQVQKVVTLCNTWVLGKKKDARTYENCYSAIYCRYAGETHVSKQHLHPLTQEQIYGANFSPTQLRRWFDVNKKIKSLGTKNIEICKYYPKIPPHMIEFAFKPAYIVEEKIKIGDYESELVKLYRFMQDNHGYEALDTRNRDEWDNSTNKKKKILRLKEKEIVEYFND